MKSAIMTLANKIAPALGRSEALKLAHKLSRQFNLTVLIFTKLDGTVTKRVVIREWNKVYHPVGGKSTLKPGQVIFADIAKYATGEHPIISTYEGRIIKAA